MDDWQLLREYVESGAEAPFEALVRRHLDMVYATALRLVRDPQMAQDVTQAVFVLFARKAPRLSSRVIVGGWLYHTAWLVAKGALREELRRRLRETQLSAMHPSTSNDDLREQFSPEVDRAMASLAQSDQDAIVLRYLEQRTFQEVADALCISEDAAKKRVQRALEKLRNILSRRGVALSAAAISASLAATATQAHPNWVLRPSASLCPTAQDPPLPRW